MVLDIQNTSTEELSEGDICRLAIRFEEKDFISVDSLYLGQPNDHPLLVQYPHFFVSRVHFDLGLSDSEMAQSVFVYRLRNYTIPGVIEGVPVAFPVRHGGKLFHSDLCTPYHDGETTLRLSPKTQRVELVRRLQEAGL